MSGLRARVLRSLRGVVERSPALAHTYRTLRDARRLERAVARPTPYGFRFFGPRELAAGEHEPREAARVRELLAQEAVFVDVGAHVGYYTCIARAAGRRALAIEPLAGNLKYLYRNLEENGWRDTEVFPLGLAERPGLATLFGAATGASLVEGWASPSPLYARTVPLSTLDHLLESRFPGERLVVKVDVEGAEHRLLRGARRTLARSPRPVWLVEICLTEHHPSGLNPHFDETFQLFWQQGYEAWTLDPERRVGPAEVARWLAERSGGPPGCNFLFTARGSG